MNARSKTPVLCQLAPCWLVLATVAACGGNGGLPAGDAGVGGRDGRAPPRCSAEHPEGACDSGMACREGDCLDEELFCSDARPSGLCASSGDTCIDGSCVPRDQICSPDQPNGLCPVQLSCINGRCATDASCSPDAPRGFCEDDAHTCVDGECIDREASCSPDRPDGRCPDGQVCTGGDCIDEPTACSHEHPDGVCPGAEVCVDGECTEPVTHTCSPDEPTGSCPDGESCEGGACRPTGEPGRCDDGERNNHESDVDCGGPRCAPCGSGGSCTQNTDCRSLACSGGTCAGGSPSYEVDEDFETGDFSKFPYTRETSPEGGNDWEIESDPDACHRGEHCMRTSVLHETGETSSVSLALSVREDTVVSFWVKTETEEDAHFFRFYVDGELQTELSGVSDWTQVELDVPATGAGGPDRTLTWEYERSDYVNPDRPPRNAVWIDDIDMPAWNTQPTVPRLLSPGNGMVLTEPQPRFRWRSVDPDFDRIIYEMQIDTTPAFEDPDTTGETFDLTWRPDTPLEDRQVYYWRARSKDRSDYRWSEWSPVSSVRIRTEDDYSHRFRQDTADELALNTARGVEVGDVVTLPSTLFRTTVSRHSNWFSGLPQPRSGAAATFRYSGHLASRWDTGNCGYTGFVKLDLLLGGLNMGELDIPSTTQCRCFSLTGTLEVEDIASHIASDGALPFEVVPGQSRWRTSFCRDDGTLEIAYPTAGEGSITSVPIWLDTFGGASNWEKIAFGSQGDVRVQVLDENRQPLPDEHIPGNSDGLVPGTHMLMHLDSEAHPVIYLRASLEDTGTLDFWEVYANDGYRWHFGNDGDAEGWTALLDGAEATTTVDGGVMRIEAPTGAIDPRIVYMMPAEVQADRFTEIVVRLRSSNGSDSDVVTLYWENNYGMFDAVRSLHQQDFLAELQSVAFDLTVTPESPSQPWQGRIRALRIDPVERFFDAAGDPDAGWVEIESVWLR